MIKNIFKSWKTSLVGGGALTLAITTFAETGDWKQCILPALIGLLGLFSKDSNATHSEIKK